MEEQNRSIIKLITPLKQIKNQLPKLYMVTQEELDTVLGGSIKIGVIDTPHKRYIREWEEVEVIDIELIEEKTKEGKESLTGKDIIITTDKGKVKIVYTYILIKVIYAKSKNNNRRYYYRGYKIENVKNIAIKMFDGYIPLDKNNTRNTIELINHNKRHLIKRGVRFIHNELEGKIGYVETVVDSELELNLLKGKMVNIKSFIEELMEEEEE